MRYKKQRIMHKIYEWNTGAKNRTTIGKKKQILRPKQDALTFQGWNRTLWFCIETVKIQLFSIFSLFMES